MDVQGYRCAPESSTGVKLVGRQGAVVLCAGDTPENVLIAVRSVIPPGAPVDPGEIRTWSQDILEYVQTIAATLLPPDQPANA